MKILLAVDKERKGGLNEGFTGARLFLHSNHVTNLVLFMVGAKLYLAL